jgi:uncharacterized protein YndB with AHSA1/START domain
MIYPWCVRQQPRHGFGPQAQERRAALPLPKGSREWRPSPKGKALAVSGTRSLDMDTPDKQAATSDRELVITRVFDAPREKLFRAWTEPELLKHWFVPRPWTVSKVETDVRPGGANLIVMRSPDGNEFPNRGVYLEVVENARLVFTDAYTKAWQPSDKPFMTGVITFEDAGGGKTRYTARVLHWTVADREAHEEMGFYKGWNQCADQLAELVSRP